MFFSFLYIKTVFIELLFHSACMNFTLITGYGYRVMNMFQTDCKFDHSRHFALIHFAQYLLPLKVQPSNVWQWRIVRREMVHPCSFSMAHSWTGMVSSSSRIFCSNNALISPVILERQPEPGLLAMLPVSQYFFRNLAIPTQQERMMTSFLLVRREEEERVTSYSGCSESRISRVYYK